MTTAAPDNTAAASENPQRRRWRLLRRALIALLILPVALLLLVVLLLYLPPVQELVRSKAVRILSERTGAKIQLEVLRITLPLGVRLEGLHVPDDRGDTLLYAGHLQVQADLGRLLGGKILLRRVEVYDSWATVRQYPDSSFNFQHILNAFAGEGQPEPDVPPDTTDGFTMDVRALAMQRIHFDLDMQPSQLVMHLELGELILRMDSMALDPMRFHADELQLWNTVIDLRTAPGEDEPTSYPDLENPLADIDIRFKRIGLEDVRFTLASDAPADSLWMSVRKGTIMGRDMEHRTQRIALSNVELVEPRFGMLTHTRASAPDTTSPPPAWLGQNDGFRYWTQDWDISLDRLRIVDGGLALHSDSSAAPALFFDPDHLVYRNIWLDLRNLGLGNERIAVLLDSLGFTGGPGGERITVALQASATPEQITISDGQLRGMGLSAGFRATAGLGSMDSAYHAPHRIPLDAGITADVRMADLVHLAGQLGIELPAGSAAEERWWMEAWLAGSLTDIERTGLRLEGDQGTTIDMEGRIVEATAWPKSQFEVKVDELTMGRGLRQVVKAYAPPSAPLPQHLSLRGLATGQQGSIRASVALDSDLGRLSGVVEAHDLHGMLPDRIDVDLTASHIDAARLLGDTAFGPLAFKFTASGIDLHDPQRKGDLAFSPSTLTYRGNDLSSLRFKAQADGDSLRAQLSSLAEPADLQLDLRGPWPEKGDSLIVAIDLLVRALDLEALGISSRMLYSEGRITGRLAGVLDGSGRIDLRAPGLRLFNDEHSYALERFLLKGLLGCDSTSIELDCDVMRLSYHANLALSSTVDLLRARMLGAFQEPYVFVPPTGRRIDLKVDLPGTERLAALVLPELQALELERLEGRYDSDSDVLHFAIDLPLIDYAGIRVEDLKIALDANGPVLQGSLAVMRVMRDSLSLDDLLLETSNAPGTLRASLRLLEPAGDRYRIGMDLRREAGIPVMHLQEDIILDRIPWQADAGNALYLDPNGLRARDLAIRSNGQHITFRTGTDGNHLDIDSFDLGNITGLVRSLDSLALVRGTLDAHILLPASEATELQGELRINGLEVLNVALGTLNIKAQGDGPDRYTGTLTLQDPANRLDARLSADLAGEGPRVSVENTIAFSDLARFKPFVEDFLFELDGSLDGEVTYLQDGEAIQVLGYSVVRDGRLGLVQTGSIYRLPGDTVVFDEAGLRLTALTVLDAAGNRFELDGRVNTTRGMVPTLDLHLQTDRFQLVNSVRAEGNLLYGKLFAGIDLNIEGSAITPVVRGRVAVLDSTDLGVVLPGSSVELIDHEGIVHFTADFDAQDTLVGKSDSELLRDSLAAQLPGVELDLRLVLDKRARFAVVIDPTTGDQATFSGEADLVFRYNPQGDLYLQGPITVGEGGYTLEFYGLVKKRFDLVPGGTIIWDGDPLAGRMDIQARFRTTAAPYPLVANARGGLTESERNTLQVRLPFDVLINFRELVQAPVISFGLDMDRQVRNSYPQVNGVLEQLSRPANQEELNRQVFGLLVLNTFIENETGTEQGGSSLASTAARNSVNSILTQQLNRLTGEGIKGMDIQLGVNTYEQTESGQSYSRTTVDYKVTQRILNDRISIEAGGSFGADERRQDVTGVSNTRAPQYAIAYDMTPDGRLRLRLFHENAYDLYDGELINNGVAITITRDFEKMPKERERRRQQIREQRAAARNDEEP